MLKITKTLFFDSKIFFKKITHKIMQNYELATVDTGLKVCISHKFSAGHSILESLGNIDKYMMGSH